MFSWLYRTVAGRPFSKWLWRRFSGNVGQLKSICIGCPFTASLGRLTCNKVFGRSPFCPEWGNCMVCVGTKHTLPTVVYCPPTHTKVYGFLNICLHQVKTIFLVCLSVCLCVCLAVCRSFYLSLFICLSTCLSVCLYSSAQPRV